MNKIILSICLLFFVFKYNQSNAQVLFKLGDYRNFVYTSSGYNGAFANLTIGVSRRDYIKLIKKEVIGILDVSLPVSLNFFTRYAIRKGFQIELYHHNNFSIPFMFASSSIVRHNHYVNFHDITAEFSINPGIYKAKYTIALDCRYELIAFRYKKFSQKYRDEINHDVHNHWEQPLFSIGKIGIFAGLNLRRVVLYSKIGYERNPFYSNNYIPGYAIIGFGYKFGTKPIK